MVNLDLDGLMIEDVRLVIFDKDGTLMDLYHYWSQMVALRAKLICQKLGLSEEHQNRLIYEMGVDLESGRLRPEGPVGLKKREIVLQAAIDYLTSIGQVESYDLCFGVFEEVDQISSIDLKRFIKPVDGAADLMGLLSKNGCKIAIATTDKTARAKLAMEFLGFASKIDLVVGADLASKTKPDPETIYMILDTLKVDKSNTVMVGDTITDVQMGINAGLKASIGVLTGLDGEVELNRLTQYIVRSVAGIKAKNA